MYQDLFGEGVYTGKGLYDVEVFDQVLGGRFPENTVLSHDLLESTYLRAALMTDIELFDDYPTTYLSYSKRNHRWIRGDWQILQWLFNQVPAPDGKSKDRNPITIVSKWKIFDNLRRSLNPAALLVFLLLGWTVLPGSALFWTAAVVGIAAFPIYSSFSTEIFNRPRRVAWKLYLEKIRDNLKINTVQSFTTLVFMPHQAYISLDAVIRTLWRVAVSGRKLLEWTTALHTERQADTGIWGHYRSMAINVLWSGLVIGGGWYFKPMVLFLGIPFGAAWISAPLIAWYISSDSRLYKRELQPEQQQLLRKYARRTWHFFERYMTPEHSWLPPDNYQEEPYVGAVARTSPTNIGLGLASTISAYEFGYIGIAELLDRVGNTLESMKLLEKYNGHFYNWYSTKLGEVLDPRYISTVDSGNLAGSLLVVKQMLLELENRPWPNEHFGDGLEDTIETLRVLALECCKQHGSSSTKAIHKQIDDLLDTMQQQNRAGDESSASLGARIQKLENCSKTARKLSEVSLDPIKPQMKDVEFEEIIDWFARPLEQIQKQLEEIKSVQRALHKSERADFNLLNNNQNLLLGDLLDLESFKIWRNRAHELASWCDEMVQQMDYSILYDKERRLFNIGYNVDQASKDSGTYDLFSSEARLASYIAIAKGDVPPEHWFQAESSSYKH
ncbi:MAG: hypothetical protein U5K69_08120 [Balneolaceae bacterium]|nr:hypothetical protein [Balneolaceae bacterium]